MTSKGTVIKLCNRMQRTVCLLIAGLRMTSSCPTSPLQALLGIPPLHLHVVETAARSAIRLGCLGHFDRTAEAPHTVLTTKIPVWESIKSLSDSELPQLYYTQNALTLSFQHAPLLIPQKTHSTGSQTGPRLRKVVVQGSTTAERSTQLPSVRRRASSRQR